MFASLHLTLACNLRCTYCYAGSKVNKSMTPEIAIKSTDFLIANSDEFLNITFFGGEPTLRFNLIKLVVERCYELRGAKPINFGMVTNGTLLTEEMIDYFKKHDVLYTLSFDGDRFSQDKGRPTTNGGSSFDLVINNIPKILNANPYVRVNVVVTPQTTCNLLKSIKFLRGLGLRYLDIQPDYGAPWDRKGLNTLRKQYLALADYYMDCHRKGIKIHINLFDDKIGASAVRPLRKFDRGSPCKAADSSISIAPSGKIYPCVQYVKDDDPKDWEWSIGDISSGIDPQKRARYLSCSKIPMNEECKGCAFLDRCSRWCSCANWQATGNPGTPSPFMCEHERMLIPIADRIGSTLWRERNRLFIDKHYNRAYPLISYMEEMLTKSNASFVETKH